MFLKRREKFIAACSVSPLTSFPLHSLARRHQANEDSTSIHMERSPSFENLFHHFTFPYSI